MCLLNGEVLAQTDVEIPDAGVSQAVARLGAESPRRRRRPDGVLPGGATPRLPIGQLYTRVEPGSRFREICPLRAGASGQMPELRAAARAKPGEVSTRANRDTATRIRT